VLYLNPSAQLEEAPPVEWWILLLAALGALLLLALAIAILYKVRVLTAQSIQSEQNDVVSISLNNVFTTSF